MSFSSYSFSFPKSLSGNFRFGSLSRASHDSPALDSTNLQADQAQRGSRASSSQVPINGFSETGPPPGFEWRYGDKRTAAGYFSPFLRSSFSVRTNSFRLSKFETEREGEVQPSCSA